MSTMEEAFYAEIASGTKVQDMSIALEVQRPFSDLILAGLKTVETRYVRHDLSHHILNNECKPLMLQCIFIGGMFNGSEDTPVASTRERIYAVHLRYSYPQ